MNCSFAGVTFDIQTRFPFTEEMLKGYESASYDGAVLIKITDEELNAAAAKDLSVGADYHESLCVYRRICSSLPFYDAFMMHSAVLRLNGKAYAFTARSGTGKTTHSLLWQRYFGAEFINGDKPVYKLENGCFYACGTPWSGKEGFNKNIKAPLSAMCFLYQSKENTIRRLSPAEVITRIFDQVYMPEEREGKERVLGLLDKLIAEVPFYLMGCDISREAAELSLKTMTEGENTK